MPRRIHPTHPDRQVLNARARAAEVRAVADAWAALSDPSLSAFPTLPSRLARRQRNRAGAR